MDYEMIVTDPSDEELNLATVGFDTDLRVPDLTLVSVGDVPMSEPALTELMKQVQTIEELQDAIANVTGVLQPAEIDILREDYNMIDLAEHADDLQFYTSADELFESQYELMSEGINPKVIDQVIDNLNVTEFVKEWVADEEYVFDLGNGTFVDTSMLG